MSGVDKLLEVLKNISERSKVRQQKERTNKSREQIINDISESPKHHWRCMRTDTQIALLRGEHSSSICSETKAWTAGRF